MKGNRSLVILDDTKLIILIWIRPIMFLTDSPGNILILMVIVDLFNTTKKHRRMSYLERSTSFTWLLKLQMTMILSLIRYAIHHNTVPIVYGGADYSRYLRVILPQYLDYYILMF